MAMRCHEVTSFWCQVHLVHDWCLRLDLRYQFSVFTVCHHDFHLGSLRGTVLIFCFVSRSDNDDISEDEAEAVMAGYAILETTMMHRPLA